MSDLDQVETCSRDQMTAHQSELLGEQVAYAFNKLPFYRVRLGQSGLAPGDIRSLEDLKQLPFTVKADLVDNFPYGMCAVEPERIVRVHSSSGTTGRPLNTYYTAGDLEKWGACTERNARIAGVTPQDVCQIAFKYTLFTGAFGHHLGVERIGAMVIPTSAGQTERQIMMMQELRTTVIHCTPSYAAVLAEKLREMGIAPGELALRLGIHGAEPMSEERRAQVEAALGITCVRDYGLTELGGPGVSIECPQQAGYHINEDFFFPEIVDPDTLAPLPYGETGELVFTTLQKEATPLIRYRTRDITYLTPEACGCGRTLIRHGPILGRSDDMLIIGGVNFFPSQLESVVLSRPEVSPHYYIHLYKSGPLDAVSLDVETTAEYWGQASDQTRQELARAIEARAKDLLGFKIRVKLTAPGSLERSEGKTKRVIDQRGRG